MNREQPHLSLVIPAYNEAQRIPGSLRTMAAYLARQPFASEVLVVDDGSRDQTSDVVKREAAQLPVPVRVLRYAPNRGKGHALKVGFAAARGARILFADADLATPIEEAERLLRRLDEGYDVAIGSRKVAGADIRVHQPWVREQMGRIFTLLVRWLVADVTDATCGFKAYRGEAGRQIFARLRIPDWSFDAEALLVARQLGFRIAEVPVSWEDRAGTKVSLRRDVLRSLLGLVRIRLNALRRVYRSPLGTEAAPEVWSSVERDRLGSAGRVAAKPTT